MSSGYEQPPLITIIIAVFNGVDTLQQCIDSVTQQSYPAKELIVIDGDSKDGTVELLKANQEKINYWVSEPDSGVYNAWNKGLAQANGDWIYFLGADDYFWDNQVLDKLGEALTDIPVKVRLAYAQVMLLGTNDEPLFPVGEPWEAFRERFHQGACLPHQGVMHRRSLFEQTGIFDESFRIGGDYEIMLRELKAAEAIFIPDIVVTAMRQGGLSSNPAEAVQAMLDIRRAQKMHGQYWPSYFWLKAMVRVYIRLLLWKVVGEKKARAVLDLGRKIKGVPRYWTKT